MVMPVFRQNAEVRRRMDIADFRTNLLNIRRISVLTTGI